jgi:RNA polymerase II subunit A-like phosphatase
MFLHITRACIGERLKSLKRLFPSDQSMVVIIDDRADIWNWSPHLVKVIPCATFCSWLCCLRLTLPLDEFFVGTGDINSATLPKQKSSIPIVPAVVPPEPEPSTSPSVTPSQSSIENIEALSPTVAEEKLREEEQRMKKLNADEVEELLEGHPLAKAQEELDAQAEEEVKQESEPEPEAEPEAEPEPEPDQKSTTPPGTPPSLKITTPPDCNGKMKDVVTRTPTPKTESLQHHIHRAILHNNDNELDRIQRILEEVHSSFFVAYDARSCATTASKLKGKSKEVEVDESDVSVVIPRRMRRTFEGCHLAFSSIIPLNEKPER